MTGNKTLCALVGSLLVASSCDNSAYEEQFTLRAVEPDTHFQELYDSAQAVARHKVPFVEIEAKKSSLTLDPLTHVGNAVKALKLTLPVTEGYYSSVDVGDELSSKDNTAGLVLELKIEGYTVSISDKSREDLYYLRTTNGWKAIDKIDYDGLVDLNVTEGEFTRNPGQ